MPLLGVAVWYFPFLVFCSFHILWPRWDFVFYFLFWESHRAEIWIRDYLIGVRSTQNFFLVTPRRSPLYGHALSKTVGLAPSYWHALLSFSNRLCSEMLCRKACEGDIAEGCHRYASSFIRNVHIISMVTVSEKAKRISMLLKLYILIKPSWCVHCCLLFRHVFFFSVASFQSIQ